MNNEVRGVLIPIVAGQLLLPNLTLAEVTGYREPDPVEGMPDWVLGTMAWHRHAIPVISFEQVLNQADFTPGLRARIAVCRMLNGLSQYSNIGVMATAVPRLIRVTLDNIEPMEGPDLDSDLILRRVRVGEEEAIIPDLDAIERYMLKHPDRGMLAMPASHFVENLPIAPG